MIIIAFGAGDYTGADNAAAVLERIHREAPITLLATCCVSETDKTIAGWAAIEQVIHNIYDIDFDRDLTHAVLERNQRMIAGIVPDLILLFGSSLGTKDMADRAAKLKI